MNENKITSPLNCPYRDEVSDSYYCGNPRGKIRYCTWLKRFPTGCPIILDRQRDDISKLGPKYINGDGGQL
jgi:hypothetical protein